MKPTAEKRLWVREKPVDKIVLMKQNWRDLLFLHWEVDASMIQQTLPEGLYVDTYNNKAYLGLTPFHVFDLRPILIPSIPIISNFPEVNVRTYVYDKTGRPGIWFYSLDAHQRLDVKIAQMLSLPYKYAEIDFQKNKTDNEISVSVKREETAGQVSKFRYKMKEYISFAEPETLEFFLIERYLLFVFSKWNSKLYSVQVHHKPYPLYDTEVNEYDTKLIQMDGFSIVDKEPDHKIMSTGVDVEVYQPAAVN